MCRRGASRPPQPRSLRGWRKGERKEVGVGGFLSRRLTPWATFLRPSGAMYWAMILEPTAYAGGYGLSPLRSSIVLGVHRASRRPLEGAEVVRGALGAGAAEGVGGDGFEQVGGGEGVGGRGAFTEGEVAGGGVGEEGVAGGRIEVLAELLAPRRE